VAEVFDGRGPTGGIVVDRPPVDPGEIDALTAYLTKAPVALATTKTGEDELSPGAGLVVPRAYHTDGEWIWPAAVGYYLHRYRLPPQPDLVAHIRAHGFMVGMVAEELRQAAAAQMLEALAAAKRAAGAPVAAAPAPIPAPPAPPVESSPVPPAPAVAPYAPIPQPPESTQAEATLWLPAPADQPEVRPSEDVAPEPAAPAVPAVPAATSSPSVPEAAPSSPVTPPASSSFFEPAPKSAPTPPPLFLARESEPEPAPELELESEPGPRLEPEPESEPEPVSVSTAPPAGSGPSNAATDAQAAAAAALTVASFSAALTAAGNRHAAWVYEQIETFLDYMPLDEWSVDHGTRRYRQAGREFSVDALGRLAHDGRWIWAWAEPGSWSADPALTERSRLLRDEGGRLGIKELTAPVLDLSDTADADDPEIAAEMLAWTAMGVAGARGYIGHTITDESRIYYLAFDDSIPMAAPDIDGVPHFLSHGIAKFEEDATDCVLGYVEHYGWDWSRSAGGIVVSAGALGSFTADLSEDGMLTGISLQR
jgi:hypothetical protein